MKNQRGSIMLEAVACCMVLVILMLGIIEVVYMVRDDIYLQKIVREGAREVALTKDTNAGKRMAESVANQYFPDKKPAVLIYTNNSGGQTANVTCAASYNYTFFSFLKKDGYGGVQLNAEAIYPCWDENI